MIPVEEEPKIPPIAAQTIPAGTSRSHGTRTGSLSLSWWVLPGGSAVGCTAKAIGSSSPSTNAVPSPASGCSSVSRLTETGPTTKAASSIAPSYAIATPE